MQTFTGTTTQPKMIGRDIKIENGLQNLAEYYQSMFDVEENINHYSWKDYLNARQKFVKYLMKCRVV